MKYHYRLIVNHGGETRKPYQYTFARTKDIQLHMHSGSAMIAFSQGVLHGPDEMRSSKVSLCVDAIKKAMMVHLILYGKPLDIRLLEFAVNEQCSEVYSAKKEPLPLVYSMINQQLDYPLPAVWHSDAVISMVLNSTKTAYDGRQNALVALLLAKSKMYRSEKSMYLWMAMNGLYGFLSQIANDYAVNRKSRITAECDEHNLLCQIIGIGNALVPLKNEDKNMLMLDALSILKHCETEVETLYEQIRNKQENPVVDQLKAKMGNYNVDMDPYTFFCIWLPYRIRCSYFHTNNALPLFSYADEPLLKALQYTNYFVEHFIETYLPEWLESKIITEEQKERIHQAYMVLLKAGKH